jgi:hypothetical protein
VLASMVAPARLIRAFTGVLERCQLRFLLTCGVSIANTVDGHRVSAGPIPQDERTPK